MARELVKTITDNRKNYIINGDMAISQRGTSFAAIANNTYFLDRYVYSKVGAMIHTATQDTDVPTQAQAKYLFQNSLRLNLTTPDTSIATGDRTDIQYRVEGYDWANLAQKTFTLSFWVKATLAGTYCVGFRNSGTDRSYVAEYTVNASNTWEYKTITVPASPSAGTWNYTNGVGLYISFTLAAGTSFHTTAGSWQTGSFIATANQINGTNTGATDFRITGVMLNEGATAAPFSLFGNDFEGELLACQRYCAVFGGGSAGRVVSPTDMKFYGSTPVTMRATPTISLRITSNVSAEEIGVADRLSGAATISEQSSRGTNGFRARISGFSSLTAGNFCNLGTDAIQADAEL